MQLSPDNTNFRLGDRVDEMNALPPACVDFIFTSPPYNVGIAYGNHHDRMTYDGYLGFLNETWVAAKRVLKSGGRIAINVPSITYEGQYKCLYADVIQQLQGMGMIMRGDILWYKQAISKRTAWGSFQSPSNPHVVQPYEFILVFSKNTKKHAGNKCDIDITKREFIEFSNAFWNIKAETALSKKHPAPFPQELVYRLIKFYTYRGDVVLDMFGGSGTTALVAHKLGRKSIYIDNHDEYFHFAKKRVLCNGEL